MIAQRCEDITERQRIRYLKSDQVSIFLKAMSDGSQIPKFFEAKSAPTALTMRMVKEPLSGPRAPILQGYMLFRNANGGYYLMSTTDAGANGSIVINESTLIITNGDGVSSTSPFSQDQMRRQRKSSTVHSTALASTSVKDSTSASSPGRFRAILPKGQTTVIVDRAGLLKSGLIGQRTTSLYKVNNDEAIPSSSAALTQNSATNELTSTEKDFSHTTGIDAAAFVTMTGLDSTVFNFLRQDLETKAASVWKLRQLLKPRDALSLILLWLRHDPSPAQMRHWFVGEEKDDEIGRTRTRQRDQQWQQIKRLRQRWLPFLASWMKDFVVWSDPISEDLPFVIYEWLSSTERIGRPECVIGVVDPLILPVKEGVHDDCCKSVAIFIIVYNFSGAIAYRSPAYWAACPHTSRPLFENGVRSAISACYERDLRRLMEPSQMLLAYSKDIGNNTGQLPSAIRFVKSPIMSNLLKDKFDDRLKRQFRVLTSPLSPDTTSLRLLCLNEIVTVCSALSNLTAPISWEGE